MSIPASGTVALVGAGEYLPLLAAVDKLLLERVHGIPRVVVLPTAAAPDGTAVAERWAEMGVKHFSQLEVHAEAVMLLTRRDAGHAGLTAQIAAANFIYLSGGKPRYLLEVLQGTTAWQSKERGGASITRSAAFRSSLENQSPRQARFPPHRSTPELTYWDADYRHTKEHTRNCDRGAARITSSSSHVPSATFHLRKTHSRLNSLTQ